MRDLDAVNRELEGALSTAATAPQHKVLITDGPFAETKEYSGGTSSITVPKGAMTMRFMIVVKSAEQACPIPPALMEAIGKLGAEATRAGALVETGGLLPTAVGMRVRLAAGKLLVTDGPFAESKEVIGGFAVYNVKSKEEALEWTTRFMQLHKEHWPGWEGEAEIRQMFETPSECQPG
jgi:hypothetical protein